jgi:hypothetical protein
MQYRGVEYSIVQLIEGSGWRWEIKFGDGNNKSGVTPISRAAAIKLAEYEIDRALKDGKLGQLRRSDRAALRRDVVRIMGTLHDGVECGHFQRCRVSLAFRGTCQNLRSDLSFHRRRALCFGKRCRCIVKDGLHQFD